ncbi:SPOR domain-containing protein [Patescibacteria group bacterium]|nr:SPOR domain-containing protein [Patescibacteria group bacterium]MBU1957127.1 SPOR domain-containing protein [bacterium]
MKKIILLTLLLMGLGHATEYQVVHLKKGGTLNVREVPVVTAKTVVGRIPAYATGIRIKECKYNAEGKEWCYINYPLGGSHIEGWVNSYFLSPMQVELTSTAHIKNFLYNFYMADEENFLDKLQVFYTFPMQQYMSKKNISLMDLRSKKVHYYKQWPKRDYRLSYLKILKRKPDYIDVQTTVNWNIKNHADDQSGKDIQKLRLIPTGSSFKILALKNLMHTVFPKPQLVEELNATVDMNQTMVAVGETKYYIKVGSFFSEINKDYLANITKNGFAYMTQVVKQDNNTIRRLYIGPYDTTLEAVDALKNVREKINENAYIQSLVH